MDQQTLYPLLFSLGSACLGTALGAALMALFCVLTAARADAANERDHLLELLIEGFEIEPEKARAICEQGESTWAQWRIKTRPLLWRWGYDWPEYSQTLRAEFEQHYEQGLPEAEPSPTASDSQPEPLEVSGDMSGLPGVSVITSSTSESEAEPTPDNAKNS